MERGVYRCVETSKNGKEDNRALNYSLFTRCNTFLCVDVDICADCSLGTENKKEEEKEKNCAIASVFS